MLWGIGGEFGVVGCCLKVLPFEGPDEEVSEIFLLKILRKEKLFKTKKKGLR